jgi:hypothetical protein
MGDGKVKRHVKLVAPYNGWTIAFLYQLYVTLLCFTPSEHFIFA